MQYRQIVDAASSQPGNFALPLPSAQPPPEASSVASPLSALPLCVIQELWRAAEAEACGLNLNDFSIVLNSVGARHNYGLPMGVQADASQQSSFMRGLRLPELALAHACALGHEAAWRRFLDLYRSPLTQAAISIAGSATLGHDLVDSLYSELYGLQQRDGQRRSPLASYSGRGSLLGWLRTTLAQRHVDHYRRTHREIPLGNLDVPSASASSPSSSSPTPAPLSAELARLTHALARTLQALPPEDRFLLSSYFLDRHTLFEIARTLHVHEATISRRLKRLASSLRSQLLQDLQSSGLSKRAAEEALGTDPRDIEINLRGLLQTSQPTPFSARATTAKAATTRAATSESSQP